jgi:hypothetical protein
MNYSNEINDKKKTIYATLAGDIKTKELSVLDIKIRMKAKNAEL